MWVMMLIMIIIIIIRDGPNGKMLSETEYRIAE